MSNAWILCGLGTLFCISGVYLFYRNVYDEEKSIKWPVVIIVMGVILVAAGTARYIFNPH